MNRQFKTPANHCPFASVLKSRGENSKPVPALCRIARPEFPGADARPARRKTIRADNPRSEIRNQRLHLLKCCNDRHHRHRAASAGGAAAAVREQLQAGRAGAAQLPQRVQLLSPGRDAPLERSLRLRVARARAAVLGTGRHFPTASTGRRTALWVRRRATPNWSNTSRCRCSSAPPARPTGHFDGAFHAPA